MHPEVVGGGEHEKQGARPQRDLHLGGEHHDQVAQPKRDLHRVQFVLLSVHMFENKVSFSTKGEAGNWGFLAQFLLIVSVVAHLVLTISIPVAKDTISGVVSNHWLFSTLIIAK